MELDASQRIILSALHRKFITGCHILHYNNVVDAYGHLSVRHPFDPQVFIMSKHFAPGTISSPDDLVEYRVHDAAPLDPAQANKGFAERHIHSEVYKRHPRVHAVVHSHADAVLPYTIAPGVPLRPCYHVAGFLGAGPNGCPEVYDAARHWRPDDVPDMLVRNAHLGAPLAACFDGGAVVALMRGHGMTVVASAVDVVVARAVYTVKNAGIQTTAMTLQQAAAAAAASSFSAPPQHGQQQQQQQVGLGLHFLDQREAEAATQMGKDTAQRPWKLWAREVEASGLYTNSA